tara:strand:+ start:581 stop:1189 length:609 start_codon:yes stop_codon:yes gene_type:complete
MEKKYYTSSEAAKLLMVSEATIRRLCNAGTLPAALTSGGHRRFTQETVAEYAAKRNIQLDIEPRINQKQSIKILIVDDDKGLNKFFCTYFTKHFQFFDEPVEVEQAFDGFEAGRLIEKFPPDLVILDIRMPGIDGEEVCKRICSLPAMSECIIVAVTGYYTDEIAKKMVDAGADCCIEKPIASEQLQPFIKRLLIKNANKSS